ncbi:hypothetical protein BKA66DRAFT_447260 [Pyrenochaeta sp. MPI-SDFR-AT-0127]|nr:hypothetical protein BKA66DRAFT_447260 [Pyrenochaeta sp. MPI-SDFR-AT-0127]
MANHIKLVREGLDKAIPDYGTFAILPPTINLVISPDLPNIDGKPANANGLTVCRENRSACYIWIRNDRPDEIGDPVGFQRTTSHELYHAIQGMNHEPFYTGPPSGWWIEGSPSFFGVNYYPDHRTGLYINAFYPNNPLYSQCQGLIDASTHECRGYGAFLFFQFLSNKGLSLKQIHNLVMRQSGSNAVSDARRTMSRDADMTQYWPLFAQAYRDKKILFSDRTAVPLRATEPSIYDIVEQVFPVTLARNGDSKNIQIKVKTFAIAVGKFTIKGGLTVNLKIQPLKTGSALYWRAGKATVWEAISGDPTLVVPCPGSLKLEFIFTSTRDAEDDVAELSVTRKSRKKCRCKRQVSEDEDEDDDEGDEDGESQSCPIDEPSGGTGFVLWPLYSSSTGGGYCPTGTHSAKFAIWCCPDGTELDEAVASEASICCDPGTDCSKDIIPNNLRCADPSWTLWSKEFREVGCCMEGYVPNLHRYCVTDKTQLGRGYSILSYGVGAATAITPTTSPTSSLIPSRVSSNTDTTMTGSESALGDMNSLDQGFEMPTSKSTTATAMPGVLESQTEGNVATAVTNPTSLTTVIGLSGFILRGLGHDIGE